MTTRTTTLPAELRDWRPTILPGSLDAVLAGCLCPEQQQHGQLTFEEDCPIHTEEIRTGWTKYLNMKVQF